MDRKDIVYYFFSSAKNQKKRIRITESGKKPQKGCVQDVTMENNVITASVDGEIYVIDLNKSEVRTSIFDHRVIHVDGEPSFKIQLW